MYHLFRTETTTWIANGVVIAAGANWTTPADLRTVAGINIPADAKGVMFWVLGAAAAAGADLYVTPQGAAAPGVRGNRVGRSQGAGTYDLVHSECLFGLTAGVPNGLLTFYAVAQNWTIYVGAKGYIA